MNDVCQSNHEENLSDHKLFFSSKNKNFKEDDLLSTYSFHRRNKNDCFDMKSEISEGLRIDLDGDADYNPMDYHNKSNYIYVYIYVKVKKDPQNKHFNFYYEIQFYGKHDFIFEFQGGMRKSQFREKTEIIRSLPNHLKYTLFANEKIQSIRTKDLSFVNISVEELKEKGNKMYKRGKFREAIDFYVEAYGLLRWIEFKDPQNYSNLFDKQTPILDDEIVECRCSKTEEDEDSDNLVISLLLCLSYAYMELRHYHSALDCLNECLTYGDDDHNADVYFRKSQARMYNKTSDIENLNLALEDIQKALGICAGTNDWNYQIYSEHYHILRKFIEDKSNFEQEKIKNFILDSSNYFTKNEKNVKMILEIAEHKHQTQEMQYKVLKEMKNKYKVAIKYYNETKNDEQLSFAYKEIENFLENYHCFKFIFKLNVQKSYPTILSDLQFEYPNAGISLQNKQFPQFLQVFKYKIADSIFQEGNFNLDLVKYAIGKVNQDMNRIGENMCSKDNSWEKDSKELKIRKVFTENTKTKLSLFLSATILFFSVLMIFTHYYLYSKNPMKFIYTLQRSGLIR